MKKFLVAALASVMALSMTMTAFAAPSPSSSSNSSSSSSSSSKSKSKSKSKGGSSSSAAASSSSSSSKSSSSSASSAQAAANAAVTAVYRPTQAVITADGRSVATTVNVGAQSADIRNAFTAVAQVFGVAVTDAFSYSATGLDPAATITTAFAPGSIPAGSALMVVDAFGNLTIVVPTIFPDGTVAAVLPAVCQVAVVAVPAVPAA